MADGDEGVDVANHQRGLPWRLLAQAGKTFGWFKLTEGIGYIDDQADEHEASAAEAGLAYGPYHFARYDTNTPRQDAEHFSRVVNQRNLARKGLLPPMLDTENPWENLGREFTDAHVIGAPSIRAWCTEFLKITMDLTGRTDLTTYASTSWITDKLGGEDFMPHQDMGLLVAHYGRAAGQPGWKTSRVIGHQYRSDGTVPGWNGKLDFNKLLVPLSSLLAGGGVPNPNPGGGGTPGASQPWPLPAGHYFGLITGPRVSHGGASVAQGGFPGEADLVRKIQRRLCELGYARRNNGGAVTDCNAWSDGKYEEATRAAMIRYQNDNPRIITTGNVWPADWAELFPA